MIRRAGPADGAAVQREFAAYFAFLGELKRMWIRPGCRGLGLGRRLMDRCLEEARALGCPTLRLDSERRLEAAMHLYRSYGFREIPDYNGNPRAEVWMEAQL